MDNGQDIKKKCHKQNQALKNIKLNKTCYFTIKLHYILNHVQPKTCNIILILQCINYIIYVSKIKKVFK